MYIYIYIYIYPIFSLTIITLRQINLCYYHVAVNIICIYAVAYYKRITNYC